MKRKTNKQTKSNRSLPNQTIHFKTINKPQVKTTKKKTVRVENRSLILF